MMDHTDWQLAQWALEDAWAADAELERLASEEPEDE